MGKGIQEGMAERPRDQNVSGLWDLLVVALAGGRGPKPRVAAVNKVNRFFNTHFMEIMSSDAFPNAYFVVRKKNNPTEYQKLGIAAYATTGINNSVIMPTQMFGGSDVKCEREDGRGNTVAARRCEL